MVIIEKKIDPPHPLTGRETTYYQDKEGNRYRRVVGALSWPSGDKPGMAVILSEDYYEDPTIKRRSIRLQHEFSSISVRGMFKCCSDIQRQYAITEWLGDTSKPPFMNALSNFNAKNRGQAVSISEAQFFGDPQALEFYLFSIMELTLPGVKSLYFGESEIPAELEAVSSENISKLSAANWPAILALGYAVTELEEEPFDPSEYEAARQQMIQDRSVNGI